MNIDFISIDNKNTLKNQFNLCFNYFPLNILDFYFLNLKNLECQIHSYLC